MELSPYQLKLANEALHSQPSVCHDPRSDFLKFMTDSGYSAPKHFKIGTVDRIDSPSDRPHQNSGWYIYNEIDDTTEDGYSIGIATFGDWKTDEKVKWSSRSERQMSEKELLNFREKTEIMRQQYEEEQRRIHHEAAARAYQLWDGLPKAGDNHPYLKAKGIKAADGVKISPDNELIIPADIDGKITTIQYIKAYGEYEVNGNSIGNKKFMGKGKSKGAGFTIKGKQDVIYVAEGYSTGMSVHMATDKMVRICFNCHNIYDQVAYVKEKYPDAIVIIAGDDDFKNDVNAGRKYADAASQAHDVMAVYANGLNDFNDYHVQHGLDELRKILLSDGRTRKYHEKKKEHGEVTRPIGVLGHIYDYYNATSGNPQTGFAVQTALAICSTILGRRFKTNLNNYPALYFINVGKSGTGKEHVKTMLEKVVDATGFSSSISGDGFTSAGAVYSVLLQSPNTAVCIDEMGRYLEASASSNGESNQRQANTKIMEAFGRTHSVMRPPNYSTMTLTKEAQRDVKSRFVHNPSLTIIGMTTPSTLFKTLTMDAIKDGFVNRFLIYISDTDRSIMRFTEDSGVPNAIIEWAEKIKSRMSDDIQLATEPATPDVLDFTDKAMELIYAFQQETKVDIPNALDKYGMPEISGRSHEIAMRASLIHALSRDPLSTVVNEQDVGWSIAWVRMCLHKTIEALKMTVSSSDYESSKKEILADMRKRGKDGITWAQMQRTPPFSKYNKKELRAILDALRDAELADFEPHNPKGKGRPTELWYAV